MTHTAANVRPEPNLQRKAAVAHGGVVVGLKVQGHNSNTDGGSNQEHDRRVREGMQTVSGHQDYVSLESQLRFTIAQQIIRTYYLERM